ncbi:MAG TPA: hypothetical protein VMF69_02000 [Gemmataceae bacterium]|nr:hypothetical protein [Gemmataceae bacterium]
MGTTKPSPRFQVGDRVKILYSEWRGRIVAFRGPLGPGGAFVYGVRIPLKPKPRYIELLEDQLVAIPTRPKKKPSPSGSQELGTQEPQGDGAALPNATTTSMQFFRAGDRVNIRETNWRGRVIELRIPSLPGGGYVYRVRVPAEPRAIYLEIPANYLVAIPKTAKKKATSSTRRRVPKEDKER